jgi:predicted anti-sigma-YlaC factor YlaD
MVNHTTAASASTQSTSSHTGTAASLLSELSKADRIIAVMRTSMTPEQILQAAAKLEAEGVSPEGMTRRQERRAVIDAAIAADIQSQT